MQVISGGETIYVDDGSATYFTRVLAYVIVLHITIKIGIGILALLLLYYLWVYTSPWFFSIWKYVRRWCSRRKGGVKVRYKDDDYDD